MADPLKTYYDDIQSVRGNARRIWVAYTLVDRRIEIGVEYMRNAVEHVYHARKAQRETIRRAVHCE